MKKIISFAAIALLIISCVNTKNTSPDMTALYKKWTLMGWSNQNEPLPTTMKEVFINFAENQVNGQSGCNNYFGGYKITNDKLTFDKLGSTMMACNDESMNMERKFHQMLEKVNRYSIENDVLFLYRDKELLAQFK